jgi:hypothetical protein
VNKILASTDQRVVQLDRAVVLGFVGSLLPFLIGQGAMAIWWASEVNTRIANVEGISKARDTLPEESRPARDDRQQRLRRIGAHCHEAGPADRLDVAELWPEAGRPGEGVLSGRRTGARE